MLDTGLADARRPRRAPVAARPLRPAPTVARPANGRAMGRRGRARRRPGRPARRQAGHGTFISGVVRQTVPGRLHPPPGRPDELRRRRRRVGRRRDRAGHRRPTPPHRHRGDGVRDLRPRRPAAADGHRDRPAARRSVVVASAGNDATSRPYYPAALPGVVGRRRSRRGRAGAFSNFGPWVDASTPASTSSARSSTTSTTATRAARRDEYRGWAPWSGTSFAAPKVAGVIAQEMYLHGRTATRRGAPRSGPGVPPPRSRRDPQRLSGCGRPGDTASGVATGGARVGPDDAVAARGRPHPGCGGGVRSARSASRAPGSPEGERVRPAAGSPRRARWPSCRWRPPWSAPLAAFAGDRFLLRRRACRRVPRPGLGDGGDRRADVDGCRGRVRRASAGRGRRRRVLHRSGDRLRCYVPSRRRRTSRRRTRAWACSARPARSWARRSPACCCSAGRTSCSP